MKIELWWIGKTNEKYLNTGIDVYTKRLVHYLNFQIIEIKDIKAFKSQEDLKLKEGDAFLKNLDSRDFIILLDEKGKTYDSLEFSHKLQEYLFMSAYKRIIFIIAGAFGASPELKNRANFLLSLSNMTFPHQLIRLIFLEQLYRASTILNNEKYHNY